MPWPRPLAASGLPGRCPPARQLLCVRPDVAGLVAPLPGRRRVVEGQYAAPCKVLEQALDVGQVQVCAGTHLHLPDIEGLFEDLTGRGILAFDDASATWQWGDKAGDVRAYAKQLARGRAAPGQT